MRKPTKAQRECWDASNLRAARIILESPEKHPGFMVEWATRFMQRHTEETTGQRSLFLSGAGPNGSGPEGGMQVADKERDTGAGMIAGWVHT